MHRRPQDYARPVADSMILRNATVKAVDTTDRTCTITIDGADVTGVPYLAHLNPAAGLKVKVAAHRHALLIVGSVDPRSKVGVSAIRFAGTVPDRAGLDHVTATDGDVYVILDENVMVLHEAGTWHDLGGAGTTVAPTITFSRTIGDHPEKHTFPAGYTPKVGDIFISGYDDKQWMARLPQWDHTKTVEWQPLFHAWRDLWVTRAANAGDEAVTYAEVDGASWDGFRVGEPFVVRDVVAGHLPTLTGRLAALSGLAAEPGDWIVPVDEDDNGVADHVRLVRHEFSKDPVVSVVAAANAEWSWADLLGQETATQIGTTWERHTNAGTQGWLSFISPHLFFNQHDATGAVTPTFKIGDRVRFTDPAQPTHWTEYPVVDAPGAVHYTLDPAAVANGPGGAFMPTQGGAARQTLVSRVVTGLPTTVYANMAWVVGEKVDPFPGIPGITATVTPGDIIYAVDTDNDGRPDTYKIVHNGQGQQGPPGPQGPMGAAVSIQGAVGGTGFTDWTTAFTATPPAQGHAYIVNVLGLAGQPTVVNAATDPVTVGDLLFYDGAHWHNGGKIVGPQGPPGPAGTGAHEVVHFDVKGWTPALGGQANPLGGTGTASQYRPVQTEPGGNGNVGVYTVNGQLRIEFWPMAHDNATDPTQILLSLPPNVGIRLTSVIVQNDHSDGTYLTTGPFQVDTTMGRHNVVWAPVTVVKTVTDWNSNYHQASYILPRTGHKGDEALNTADDRSWVHDGTTWVEREHPQGGTTFPQLYVTVPATDPPPGAMTMTAYLAQAWSKFVPGQQAVIRELPASSKTGAHAGIPSLRKDQFAEVGDWLVPLDRDHNGTVDDIVLVRQRGSVLYVPDEAARTGLARMTDGTLVIQQDTGWTWRYQESYENHAFYSPWRVFSDYVGADTIAARDALAPHIHIGTLVSVGRTMYQYKPNPNTAAGQPPGVFLPFGDHYFTHKPAEGASPIWFDRGLLELGLTGIANDAVVSNNAAVDGEWVAYITGQARAECDLYLLLHTGSWGQAPVDAPVQTVGGKNAFGPWHVKAGQAWVIEVRGAVDNYGFWDIKFAGQNPAGQRIHDHIGIVNDRNARVLPAFGVATSTGNIYARARFELLAEK